MKKIKVLHFEITDNFGGIESFLLNLYSCIDRERFQFDLVTRYESPARADDFQRLGGQIFKASSYTDPLNYYRDIRKILNKGYDVIHIHKNSAANILPFFAARRTAGIPIIAHSHNTAPTGGGISPFLHKMNRKYLWNASCFHLACSKAAGQWMYGNNRTYQIVKNGIDTKRFAFDPQARDFCRKELGMESCFVIGHVGRFTEQKNHRFLIEVFKEIAGREPSARLLLVGDGPLKDEICQLAGEYRLNKKVIFVGATEMVETYMCAMDIFVLPSLYEGLGIVNMEAQASGLPCIVSDTVPEEAKLTGRLEFVPLASGAGAWADKILRRWSEGGYVDREDAWVSIREAGYDISDTAQVVQKLYQIADKAID